MEDVNRFSIYLFIYLFFFFAVKFIIPRDDGFDFVVSPLSHPRYQRDFTGKFPTSSEPFTRSDLLLSSYQWSQWTVGKVSVFSGFDSPNYTVRTNAQKVSNTHFPYLQMAGTSTRIRLGHPLVTSSSTASSS